MDNDAASFQSLPNEARYPTARPPPVRPGRAYVPSHPHFRSHSYTLPSHQSSRYTVSRRSSPRISVFKELNVDTMLDAATSHAHRTAIDFLTSRPTQRLQDRPGSFDSVQDDDDSPISPNGSDSSELTISETEWMISWRAFSSSRLMMLALVLLVTIPLVYDSPLMGRAGPSVIGVKAGLIRRSGPKRRELFDGSLVARQASDDTAVCNRWSHQSALVNGTIYLYGGHNTTSASQTSDTWHNDFLTIDVTKSWDISSPAIARLPQPSGPPPVANGYLWNSYDTLYLYGGEYSDTPVTNPSPYSLWQYNIAQAEWTEIQNPQTSAGNNSDGGNQPVLGSAEGAGITVPELGRGFYFAGHQDSHTTPGAYIPKPFTISNSKLRHMLCTK